MCGADDYHPGERPWVRGSPPRVRSRLHAHVGDRHVRGITSACAEQTDSPRPDDGLCRDHLRVCGADFWYIAGVGCAGGSPPRVRSRLVFLSVAVYRLGITSACAEQTMRCRRTVAAEGDHLRVCGADWLRNEPQSHGLGSPPRVRSRRTKTTTSSPCRRITSACAEQTSHHGQAKTHSGDHLRVCGADSTPGGQLVFHIGSPPRVRSRQFELGDGTRQLRITSACAEQTMTRESRYRSHADHLRVCGADLLRPLPPAQQTGSPPRVRSRRGRARQRWPVGGITSACAEQTSSKYMNP